MLFIIECNAERVFWSGVTYMHIQNAFMVIISLLGKPVTGKVTNFPKY